MIAGDTAMMDLEQVAQRLGVSVARVRELAERNELQGFMIDGELRFRPIEVEAYAQQHEGRQAEAGAESGERR